MFRIPKLKSFFSTDIGIDLGTANSLVYAKDHGVVLRDYPNATEIISVFRIFGIIEFALDSIRIF